MKKALLAVVIATAGLGAALPAVAAPHHHQICHKVKVHQHWVNRCR